MFWEVTLDLLQRLGLREQHMIHDGTDHTKGIRPLAGGCHILCCRASYIVATGVSPCWLLRDQP